MEMNEASPDISNKGYIHQLLLQNLKVAAEAPRLKILSHGISIRRSQTQYYSVIKSCIMKRSILLLSLKESQWQLKQLPERIF